MGTTLVDSDIYVTIISFIILGVGALGATVFIIDYLRTVDLGRPVSRMILSINTGIATILWIHILRRILGEVHNFWFIVSVVMFILVDFCIWYQWYLLRKLRKYGPSAVNGD
jgi:hypothetical protein